MRVLCEREGEFIGEGMYTLVPHLGDWPLLSSITLGLFLFPPSCRSLLNKVSAT